MRNPLMLSRLPFVLRHTGPAHHSRGMGGTKPKSTFTNSRLIASLEPQPQSPRKRTCYRNTCRGAKAVLNDNRHYRHVHGRGNYIQTRESNTILPSSIEGQKCQQRAPLRSPSLSGAISSCCEGRQAAATYTRHATGGATK